MTDKEKEKTSRKTAKTASTKAARENKPRAVKKATKSTTTKRTKKAEKSATTDKPKKTPRARVQRGKPPSKVVELQAGADIEPLVQHVPSQAPLASEPPAPVASEDDSLLLEWQAPISRPRRGVRPPDKRRDLPRQPQSSLVDNRHQSDLLDIPAWPELSDEPIASPSVKAVEQPQPEPPKTQPGPRYEAAVPETDKSLGEPEAEMEAESEAGGISQPVEGDTNGEEGESTKRRRRRRRRGRNRGQNGHDQNLSQGQVGQRRPEGENSREAQPSREQQSHRERGMVADRTFERDGDRHFQRDKQQIRDKHHDREDRRDERSPRLKPEQATRGPAEIEMPTEEIEEVVEVAPDEEVWAETDAAPITRPSDKTGRLMLINVAEGDEGRIAILHQNRLEELFIERASAESHVGNIYKGRVTNVEPSIQAAFVDFGLPKNGFLHISDLQPQYFPGGLRAVEEVGRKTPRRERPPIQKCLRRGQEIIVQIIKEGIGTKGPTLTTYISIPGRYLVMMPGMNRLGVSRRIEDEDARRKMRGVLDELSLPKDMGFILRTAGMDRTKRELQQDLLYLQRLWKVVAQRIKSERAPCELYRESDLVIRTIRDVFSADFSRIIVDDEKAAEKVRAFLSIATPRSVAPVDLYKGRRPLFHEYKLEQEIDRINSRYVPLASGGSLVIESTEALVAIDVNSGRFREHDDAEETAYRINIEAAEEIARQLRLRDLGGLILCDFVDMRLEKHRRGVERALREALKKHKERAKCLRMSQFGIIEMTRQRMRPSIKRSIYRDCPHCRGSGLIKNAESMTLDIMRLLQLATHHDGVDTVEVRVAPEVGFQLQNRKRAVLHQLESESGRRIVVRADENLGPDQFSFECFDNRGGMIRMDGVPEGTRQNVDLRAKRRSGGQLEPKGFENGRETLEDVFD